MDSWLYIAPEAQDDLFSPDRNPATAVVRLNGDSIATADGLYDEIAAQLNLPEYFGRNWDALFDVLCDEQLMPAPEYHFVWTNASNLLLHGPSDFTAWLHVFASAHTWWRDNSKTLRLYIVDAYLARLASVFADAAIHPTD